MTSLPPFSLQDGLGTRAGALRDKIFGRSVFVRGVIEVSNACRQNCSYCGMRRDNRDLSRFRLELEALRDLVRSGIPPIVTDLNLQTGEDPVAIREVVLPLIETIRRETSLGVSVCLGTHEPRVYDALRAAGASYYILKIETGNADHYRQLQAPGTLEKRLEAIRYLAGSGWAVSSGFIMGLPGQTPAHVEETLDLLRRLPLAGSSVSPFIPGDQTPLAGQPPAGLEETLAGLARLRLANPHHVIPAVSALNLTGKDGYVRALQAGANLVTVNLTPSRERRDYLLYTRERFIMDEARVRAALDAAGCTPSPRSLAAALAS